MTNYLRFMTLCFLIFIWTLLLGVNRRLDTLIELCTFEEPSEITIQVDPREVKVL